MAIPANAVQAAFSAIAELLVRLQFSYHDSSWNWYAADTKHV